MTEAGDSSTGTEINISNLKLIGKGHECRVYSGYTDEEGTVWVVKVPKFRITKASSTPEGIMERYNRAVGIFNRSDDPYPFIPVTKIHVQPDGTSLILQEELRNARHVQKQDLENPEIARQIKEILERNQALARETGEFLPFLGRGGLKRIFWGRAPKLTNLLIEEIDGGGERVRITDPSFHNLRRLLSRNVYRINSFIARRFTSEAPSRAEWRRTIREGRRVAPPVRRTH